MSFLKAVTLALFGIVFALSAGAQQSGPLKIEITDGVIEPLPYIGTWLRGL